jgi:hypothetical protein
VPYANLLYSLLCLDDFSRHSTFLAANLGHQQAVTCFLLHHCLPTLAASIDATNRSSSGGGTAGRQQLTGAAPGEEQLLKLVSWAKSYQPPALRHQFGCSYSGPVLQRRCSWQCTLPWRYPRRDQRVSRLKIS